MFSHLFHWKDRSPHKWTIDLRTGSIIMTDWISFTVSLTDHILQKDSLEAVPFRLTPNIQHFVTSLGLESLFLPGMMAVARVLLGEFSTSASFELENLLLLLLKDELSSRRPLDPSVYNNGNNTFLGPHLLLFQSLDILYQRLLAMAGTKERDKLATDQLVTIASMPPGSFLPNVSVSAGAGASSNTSTSNTSSHTLPLGNASPSFVPIHQHLLDLLNAAVNPQNLSSMNPLWHPWF